FRSKGDSAEPIGKRCSTPKIRAGQIAWDRTRVFPMLRLPVPSVSFLRWVVLVVGLSAGGLLQAQIDPADVLQGGWKMIDESPALIHHENNEDFAVVRVIPGESDWADG